MFFDEVTGKELDDDQDRAETGGNQFGHHGDLFEQEDTRVKVGPFRSDGDRHETDENVETPLDSNAAKPFVGIGEIIEENEEADRISGHGFVLLIEENRRKNG